jgi:hypothetical protein
MSSTSSFHWVRDAGHLGGLSKSPKKLEALKTNAQKASKAKVDKAKYIKASDCTCGSGANLKHRVTCRIYQRVYRKVFRNQEIIWL